MLRHTAYKMDKLSFSLLRAEFVSFFKVNTDILNTEQLKWFSNYINT